MTIEIVKERLNALLMDERAKVLLLTKSWGAGKTHQWKQALKRAIAIGFKQR
jgi:predicted AAA+ superfamily ATPase